MDINFYIFNNLPSDSDVASPVTTRRDKVLEEIVGRAFHMKPRIRPGQCGPSDTTAEGALEGSVLQCFNLHLILQYEFNEMFSLGRTYMYHKLLHLG